MDKLLQKYKCAPSEAGIEWAQKFWKDEDKVVERIKQCLSEQKIKNTKGKKFICAVLGACLSCAQKEINESLLPEKVADVEYAALKSENEVLNTSLTFEKESRKKLETQINTLKGEIGYLKSQLFWANKREKHLEEKLNLSLKQVPSSVSAKQIRKVIQHADPETWDGDVWDSARPRQG